MSSLTKIKIAPGQGTDDPRTPSVKPTCTGATESGLPSGARSPRDCCVEADDESRLSAVVQALIAEHPDPATLLEIYYWSQEPGLSNVIRAYMSLPKRTRSVLGAFWQMAENPRLVSATIDEHGRLALFSPEIVDTLAVVRKAVGRTDGT